MGEEVREEPVHQLVGLAERSQRRAAHIDEQRFAVALHDVLAQRGGTAVTLGESVKDPGLLRGGKVIDL